MTTRAILNAARATLTPETWGQGHAPSNRSMSVLENQGRYCAAMAIAWKTDGPAREQQEAQVLLSQVVGGTLTDWNDIPGRTLQDVYDAFDAAIAIAEAQEQAAAAALAETPEGEPA